MIYMYDLIWVFVAVFALVGLFRGAAKELLVSVAVLVALFFITLLETTFGFISKDLKNMYGGLFLLALRLFILFFMVIAGYQTPFRERLPFKDMISSNPRLEKIAGIFIGALNGFLIFGTIWYYINDANYPPLLGFIRPPVGGGIDAKKLAEVLAILPPNWLKPPAIYFSIAIAITIILVMFV